MEESSIEDKRQANTTLNPYSSSTASVKADTIQPVNYNTGVAGVDALTQQSNQIMQNSLNAQNQAIQTGVSTNINELQRQKDLQTQEAQKQNKALYQQYQKQVNPYGATQEALAGQGLAHSGIAETTKTNIYNTYQRSLAENLGNLRNVQAQYDSQMAQVRADGDIAMAQNLSNMYLQQLEQIRNAYSMAQAQKEFEWQQAVSDRDYNYKKERDAVSDQRYQQEFEYQKERDRIADEQWQKQFNLSASRSSGGGSSSRRSYSRGSGNLVNQGYPTTTTPANPLSNVAKTALNVGKTALNLGANTYALTKNPGLASVGSLLGTAYKYLKK